MTKKQFINKTSIESDNLLKSIQDIESEMKMTNSLSELRKLSNQLEIIRLRLRFNTEVLVDLA